jgi:hypothetical protein
VDARGRVVGGEAAAVAKRPFVREIICVLGTPMKDRLFKLALAWKLRGHVLEP